MWEDMKILLFQGMEHAGTFTLHRIKANTSIANLTGFKDTQEPKNAIFQQKMHLFSKIHSFLYLTIFILLADLRNARIFCFF